MRAGSATKRRRFPPKRRCRHAHGRTTAIRMAGRISITENTYRTLTERVLSGAIPPGARVDANEIAAADGISPTPVRNALNRLVGAGLLVSHSNEGFFVPYCTEQDLRDLYDSSAALLGLAIARSANARTLSKTVPAQDAIADGSIELRTETAFRQIMSLCANRRLCGALADISLRLRPVRLLEGEWIANRDAELRRILHAFEAPDLSELNRLINAYYGRRIRLAPRIIARMQDRETLFAIDGARTGNERA